MINIINETGNITKVPAEVKGIVRKYLEQLHMHKFGDSDGMG